jgi:protein-L-isoaspartate(D-aspartate) O-methyltransferase
MDKGELDIVRRAYAKQIVAVEDVEDPRVEAAFAKVRREDFLGRGPWPILRWMSHYVTTPSADPVYLYTDDAVGILPERRLNNGVPSFHAKLMSSASPQPGEHVVHIGAGVGYYTAILAELVGASGAVTAIELDPELFRRATANFADLSHVRVRQGDAAQTRFDPADVIYVNAGATRPAAPWLDGLKEDGRLILPLTTNEGFRRGNPEDVRRRGAVFRIERRGREFLARWISGVAIFPCEGARDAASEAALAEALKVDGWREVTRLYRRDDLPAEQCWLRAPGWCLAYR